MGRKDILDKLAGFLDPSMPSMVLKIQRVFVLYGLGGGGKTQIMVKFVIDFGDRYVHSYLPSCCSLFLIPIDVSRFGGIFYVDASTLGTIQSSLEDIA
jgi:predicted GNAT family acetyltransferase